MPPLLIFLNCVERLNLAFIEDFSLFLETFFTYEEQPIPFRQQKQVSLVAMQQK